MVRCPYNSSPYNSSLFKSPPWQLAILTTHHPENSPPFQIATLTTRHYYNSSLRYLWIEKINLDHIIYSKLQTLHLDITSLSFKVIMSQTCKWDCPFKFQKHTGSFWINSVLKGKKSKVWALLNLETRQQWSDDLLLRKNCVSVNRSTIVDGGK
jgi:hypothetical protein